MNDTSPSFRLSPKIWIALVLLGFSGQLAWNVENQYFNVFMYNKITPDPKPISWMVAASAIAATITTILMGALSDRTRTRWGKRKPYILFGYILWGISTALFPESSLLQPVGVAVFVAILFDVIMTFFGSTANDAALNAYITDITNLENRGRVVSVIAMMGALAALVVYGVSGFIIDAWGYYLFFYLIGGAVFLMGLIGGLLISEPPDPTPPPPSYWGQIIDTFRIDNLKAHKGFFLLLTALALYGIADQIFFPYILIYLNHYLDIPTAQGSIVIFIGILVGAVALAYPFGMLADRIGRRKVAVGGVLVKMLGLILFSFTRNLIPLTITGIIWLGAGTAWNVSTGAWTKDLFPEEKRGQFAGYTILFNVAFTMVPGPLIGSKLITLYGIPTTIEGQAGFIPTPVLFQVAGLAVLAALIPLFFVRERRQAEESVA